MCREKAVVYKGGFATLLQKFCEKVLTAAVVCLELATYVVTMMMACNPPENLVKEGVSTGDHSSLSKHTGGKPMNVNGVHHRPTPPVHSLPNQFRQIKVPKAEAIAEEEEEEEEDLEMSAEIQASNIKAFLSSDSDSGEEQISETVITDVYKDPLDVCMEGIEDLATGILRTGKLVINGEPGDMSKIQPALFNLQACDKNLTQLLPQLLQIPFFNYSRKSSVSAEDDLFEPPGEDEALSKGLVRLAVPVDTAIYVLLRGFCAKGARQAEELINISLSENAVLSSSLSGVPMMPPIIKFQSSRGGKRNSGGATTLNMARKVSNSSVSSGSSGISVSSNVSTSTSSLVSMPGDQKLLVPGKVRKTSAVIEEEDERDVDEGTISPVISHHTHQHRYSPPCSPGSPFMGTRSHPSLTKSFSGGRRTSVVTIPRSNSADSAVSSLSCGGDDPYLIPSADQWNTSIIDNNTIVAQYGDHAHTTLWWNPDLKIDFRLSSSVGPLSGNVAGVEHSKPEVTLKVFNKTAKKIGFSLRCNRQSTVFKSHVVYPNRGLETVDPYKSWEDTVEFYPSSSELMEIFVIDLFFCTLDSRPSWNVVRKYAIMKPRKTSPKVEKDKRRVSKRRFSILQTVNSIEQREELLKLVISHGLQCVVKGKLDEAEIIFSHALYLPDFQRVPLKAFIFICLAVIANKRKKQGHNMSLKHVMMAADASNKLVSVCEQGPGTVKMPRTLQLVKQLKKELNIQKIVKEEHNFRKKANSITKISNKVAEKLAEETVLPSGRVLAYNDIIMVVPPGAVQTETLVTLSTFNTSHMISLLRSTHWDKVVQVAAAFHLETSSSSSSEGGVSAWFDAHVNIVAPFLGEVTPTATSMLRILHSNYLSHWVDVSDDGSSSVSLSSMSGKLEIETKLTGWLAIVMVDFDPSAIAQLVLRQVSTEPSTFRVSVFGFLDAERKSFQVAIYVVPCKPNEEPLHKDLDEPDNFVPISFPHMIQAFPNERLRVELQGANLEPDRENGEESLAFDMEVHQFHNDILTKWVKMKTDEAGEVSIRGKIKISRKSNSSGWDTIAHMNLTTIAASMPAASSSNSEP